MKKFFFVHNIDKSIWGDKVESNRYFASLTVLFCIAYGAFLGGTSYISDFIDIDIELSIATSVAGICTLVGMNIAESVIATKSADVAVLRSLLITALLVAGFGIGVLTSVVALIILTLIVGIWFVATLFSMMLGGGIPSGSKVVLNDGTILKNKQSDLLGTGASYTGDDGKSYHTDDGTHFREE